MLKVLSSMHGGMAFSREFNKLLRRRRRQRRLISMVSLPEETLKNFTTKLARIAKQS